MSVRKRGKGWLIDIRQGRNGKRILHTFHGTEAEAWELEHAMKRELNRALPFDHKTVSTIVPDYLEYVRTHQSEVTYKSKKKMLFGHLMATFGNTFIDCIPDTLIQQYKTKRLTEIASKTATKGGNRAINLELLCLSAMVKWATKQYLKFEQLPVSKPHTMVEMPRGIIPLGGSRSSTFPGSCICHSTPDISKSFLRPLPQPADHFHDYRQYRVPVRP